MCVYAAWVLQERTSVAIRSTLRSNFERNFRILHRNFNRGKSRSKIWNAALLIFLLCAMGRKFFFAGKRTKIKSNSGTTSIRVIRDGNGWNKFSDQNFAGVAENSGAT